MFGSFTTTDVSFITIEVSLQTVCARQEMVANDLRTVKVCQKRVVYCLTLYQFPIPFNSSNQFSTTITSVGFASPLVRSITNR